jgi:hypothetical protein
MIRAGAGLKYETGAIVPAAPPERHCVAIAMMIDQMTLIYPSEACRQVFAERLPILNSPRVRVAGVGRCFIACGEINLARMCCGRGPQI